MSCYLSSSNEDVFKDVAPPEETSIIPPEEVTPQSTQPTPGDAPTKEAAVDMTVEPAVERGPQTSSLVGRKCYIPPDLWLPLGRFPLCQEA